MMTVLSAFGADVDTDLVDPDEVGADRDLDAVVVEVPAVGEDLDGDCVDVVGGVAEAHLSKSAKAGSSVGS